ncbi:MAG: accessory gene regulator B family protein, partial [Ruminococcus sp.]|nr:accessory gene regulator B family protein [Ruminococcus sp.]
GLYRFVEKHFPNEDPEIMEYGFYILMSKIIFITSIIIIGVIFSELVPILLFTLFYTPLRSFAGGIHATTPSRCFVFSLVMLILVAMFNKYIFVSRYILFVFLILASIIIILLSPVETANKPLDEIEKNIYGIKTKIIMLIDVIVGVIFELFSYEIVLNNVMFAFFVISIMLALGEIENKNHKREMGNNNEAQTKRLS